MLAELECASGFALDPAGNEIVVSTPASISVRQKPTPVYLSVVFCERETEPVPTPHGTEHKRVEESFILIAEPTPSQRSVPIIAKLVRSRGRWRVDRRYKPRRVGMR